MKNVLQQERGKVPAREQPFSFSTLLYLLFWVSTSSSTSSSLLRSSFYLFWGPWSPIHSSNFQSGTHRTINKFGPNMKNTALLSVQCSEDKGHLTIGSAESCNAMQCFRCFWFYFYYGKASTWNQGNYEVLNSVLNITFSSTLYP